MPDPEKVIRIRGLPMPPSSNSQYNSFIRKGKICHVSSKNLMSFKRQMGEFWLYTDAERRIDRNKLISWLNFGWKLSIHCDFYFERSKLFTKKNKVKKLDVSNRLKAIHDEICRLFQIDDSYFFTISAHKIEALSINLINSVNVFILPLV